MECKLLDAGACSFDCSVATIESLLIQAREAHSRRALQHKDGRECHAQQAAGLHEAGGDEAGLQVATIKLSSPQPEAAATRTASGEGGTARVYRDRGGGATHLGALNRRGPVPAAPATAGVARGGQRGRGPPPS